MIEVINHISFTVSNLEESVKFYQEVLGLECISVAERDQSFTEAVTGLYGVAMNIAYFRASNCMIELIQYTVGAGERLDTSTNNIGSAHICFNISNYDEWIERMNKNDVRYRGVLCVAPAGPNKGKRVCYVMDNDGNNLEFMEM